jgi:hypothetical protein
MIPQNKLGLGLWNWQDVAALQEIEVSGLAPNAYQAAPLAPTFLPLVVK